MAEEEKKEIIHSSEYGTSERRAFVAEKYFNSIPPALIFKEYKQKYGLSKHSFDKDITIARREVQYSVRENYEQILNDCMDNINAILSNSLEQDDTKTALQAIKQQIDLLKLVNPDKQKVNSVSVSQTNNINLPPMSIEEMRQLLGKKSIDASDVEYKDLE